MLPWAELDAEGDSLRCSALVWLLNCNYPLKCWLITIPLRLHPLSCSNIAAQHWTVKLKLCKQLSTLQPTNAIQSWAGEFWWKLNILSYSVQCCVAVVLNSMISPAATNCSCSGLVEWCNVPCGWVANTLRPLHAHYPLYYDRHGQGVGSHETSHRRQGSRKQ